MANNKKMVEAITSMEEDFAQWYTDVVKKAELCGYTSVKGVYHWAKSSSMDVMASTIFLLFAMIVSPFL